MRASQIVAGVAVILWGYFALMGFDAMADIAAQRAPGFPNSGQRTYYLYTPLAMAVVSLFLFVATWRLKRPIGCLAGLLLAALPPYLLFYTGGM